MNGKDGLKRLDECRMNIDSIDVRILELLNQRTRIVEEIGRIKRELSMPIYEPRREEEVFENVTVHNHGPLPAEAVKRVFERIIDEMRTVQRIRMLEQQAAEAAQRGQKE